MRKDGAGRGRGLSVVSRPATGRFAEPPLQTSVLR